MTTVRKYRIGIKIIQYGFKIKCLHAYMSFDFLNL